MSWQVFRPRGRVSSRHPGVATLTVLAGRKQIRLNAPALVAIGLASERVLLLLDVKNRIIALKNTDSPQGFKPSPDRSGGAVLSCLTFLRQAQITEGSYLLETFDDDDGAAVKGCRF